MKFHLQCTCIYIITLVYFITIEIVYFITIEIDECQEGLHDCAEDIEVCVNLVGSYRCDCSIGYEWHNATSMCIG